MRSKEEIVNYLYTSLVGQESIPERLRLKEKVSQEELALLIEMTNEAIAHYKDKIFLPKRLAVCFVDIYNQFSFMDNFYPPEQLDIFEDVGIQLQELAYELFDV